MVSLFTTPWGILCGGVFLIFATAVVMQKDDLNRKETRILGVKYFIWYIATIVINYKFPQWEILDENMILYFVTSICMIEAAAFLIGNCR